MKQQLEQLKERYIAAKSEKEKERIDTEMQQLPPLLVFSPTTIRREKLFKDFENDIEINIFAIIMTLHEIFRTRKKN